MSTLDEEGCNEYLMMLLSPSSASVADTWKKDHGYSSNIDRGQVFF